MTQKTTIRQWVGVVLFDTIRTVRAIRHSGAGWLTLCNRSESLRMASDQSGVECLWRWSSELHAPRVIPQLGRMLFRRAMKAAPIRLESGRPTASSVNPVISVVIGHRGRERQPLLLATLQSFAAQRSVAFECIVVEHSESAELPGVLPDWVKLIHAKAAPGEPYNRSRTFNVGASSALGTCLVFHDNDMLVPETYLMEMIRRCREGYEMIDLKRYVFYLSRKDSARILERGNLGNTVTPLVILQNLTGGGSLGVSREAFEQVGGWDEEFKGWGGEDVDFWDRIQTRKVYPFGCFPLIHLWHEPQPEKTPEKDSPAMQRLEQVSMIPVGERIKILRDKLEGRG